MGGRTNFINLLALHRSPSIVPLILFSPCLTSVNTPHHNKWPLESKGASCLINCTWHFRHKQAKSRGTGPAFPCAPQWAFPFPSVSIDASTIHVLNVLLLQNSSFYHRENAVWKLIIFWRVSFLSQFQLAVCLHHSKCCCNRTDEDAEALRRI